MEHKSWLWKKKSTEKTMIAADKVNRGNEDELQANLADKAELQRNLKISNEKLSAALAEINAKDDIAKKQTKIAREAIQGWEKAETEVLAVKQELEKATQQRLADEERLHGAEAALKESMLQLRLVSKEQEKTIHDVVIKTTREHERTRIMLEEKLAESNERLSKLSLENAQLSKTLSANEKMLDNLHSVRAQTDYDLSAVMSRLESTQRENTSLTYEVRVLEKELEIRNEERDFNRRTADVAHKQYLESVKKIAKLETEAQRLRLLVQKRLPGPAALAKMKNVVEVTRRRSNPFPIASKEFIVDGASATSGKQITFLTEQLCAFEEENRLLKEFLNQKTSELLKSQTAIGPARNLVTSREFSIAASLSDMGSDEKVSMAESWAPSSNTVGASDIGLMDDFVEMEKLALVSVENLFASSNLVHENHSCWLDNILKVVEEHSRITQRNPSDILEDIKQALVGKNTNDESKTPENFLDGSIEKLIELIEGIRLPEKDDGFSPYKTSETPTGFTVHIFQWKTSELRAVLETFLQSCNKLLNGKVDVADFTKELTSALEWIVNHCFSFQDVSSVTDEIKKHFDWDETHGESEVEGTTVGRLSQTENLQFPKDQLPGWPMAASWNVRNKIFRPEELLPNVSEEVRKLKDNVANLELKNKDLEGRLQSESAKCASLTVLLQESEETIGKLQKEVEATVKGETEADIKAKNLDEQLADQEATSMEEQENKTTNLDEHLLPESTTENEMQNCNMNQDETTVRSVQEIQAASEKLAECQETILTLGKQLKALGGLPRDTSLSDNCEITISPLLPEKHNTQRTSLLEKMISEDATGAPRGLASPTPNQVMSPQMFVSVNGVKDEEDEAALVNFLSIVPKKKGGSNGGGMLKRLFWRRKKGGNK